MPNSTIQNDGETGHLVNPPASPPAPEAISDNIARAQARANAPAPAPILPPRRRCAYCTEYMPPERSSRLCERCNETYFRCDGCHEYRYLDERDDEDTSRCHHCTNVICDSSTRPTFNPLGNAPHLGIELEVESDSEYGRNARKALRTFPDNFAICKSDGSLSEYGFEICTRPASLEVQRSAWLRFFEAHGQRAFNLQSYTMPACGLHVHISRNGAPDWQLSEHAIALIVCFINLPKHKRFVEMIAGRYANTYTQFKVKRMQNAAVNTRDKYEAVNLSHANTLEFRIFKGTLKKESFFKALEFTEALTRFCADTYNVRVALNVNAFIKYVYAHAERYPLLAAFIDNRWFGKASEIQTRSDGSPIWALYNNRKPPLPPAVLLQGEGGH